jgi:hypothetical protein
MQGVSEGREGKRNEKRNRNVQQRQQTQNPLIIEIGHYKSLSCGRAAPRDQIVGAKAGVPTFATVYNLYCGTSLDDDAR